MTSQITYEQLTSSKVESPDRPLRALVTVSGRVHYWNGDGWDERSIASVWGRGFLWLAEVNMVLVATLLINYFTLGAIFGTDATGSLTGAAASFDFVAIPVELILYFAIGFWRGQTLGMKLAGFEVVQINTNRPPSFWRALLRSVALLPPLFLLVTAIYMIVAATGRANRGPNDFAAGTVVLNKLTTSNPRARIEADLGAEPNEHEGRQL